MVSPVENPTSNAPKKQAVPEKSFGLVQQSINARRAQKANHAMVRVFADVVEVEVTSRSHLSPKKPSGQTRGIVQKFSRKSRVNMLREVAKIRNMKNGVFATLTYPGLFLFHCGHPKEHLSALKKRILRAFPDAGIVWRMELKKRQTGLSAGEIVPHFHLLVFNLDVPVYQFRDWLAWAWNMIIDPKDLDHRVAGTQCDRIKNRKHAMRYVAKYCTKVNDDEDGQNWGRRWGICGRLDRSFIYTIPIKRQNYIDIKRMIEGVIKSRKSNYYRKMKRKGTMFSFAALGFGDMSGNNRLGFARSTIGRMITVAISGHRTDTSYLTWVSKWNSI